MARPSLAPVRCEQLLEPVAGEAGLARPLIRHYFGNRDALLAAAVERALAAHRADLEDALRAARDTDRLDSFLDHLFLGRFAGNSERDRIFRALFAGLDDAGLRRLLRETYRRFEDACFAALRARCPDAPAPAVRGTAYAIACLAEQNADFLAIGFPRTRARAARRAAAAIVRDLEEGNHG